MFGKALVLSIALAAASAAPADDLSLEPCINGGVSSSGNYPSEAMERQIAAYLNWRSYEPYYLFAVSAQYLQSPFGESDGEPTKPTR
jgi:3-methyladenine DNA glycosylase/8-oxoguanine DNA glycosylase